MPTLSYIFSDHGHSAVHHPVISAAVAAAGLHPDTDTDPRELEAFAERFKQRRIKLGNGCLNSAANINSTLFCCRRYAG